MDTSWLPPSVGQTGAAGIARAIGNPSLRATGISTYSKNGGTLETAATKAHHYSTRTTHPYDRPPL
ncbi:phage integrase family protein [Sphingobium sp. TKS]|nr:phage integrase family protein [Sphingobium sp. TKS]